MTKSKLFIGSNKPEKYAEARKLMEKTNHSVLLSLDSDRTLLNPFFFEDCTADTELVVLENIDYHQVSWFWLHEMAYSGITVQRRGKPNFKIWPKFIFISENRPLTIDYKSRSFNLYYDVVAF